MFRVLIPLHVIEECLVDDDYVLFTRTNECLEWHIRDRIPTVLAMTCYSPGQVLDMMLMQMQAYARTFMHTFV